MSITNSTSAASATSSLRGYGGLASGLDTDSLIKGMTIGTQTKIDKQMQNKQILLWQQEAFRNISSAMINFSNKYTSYTSSTNLASSSFFARDNITATGTNSSCLTVTGSLNGAESCSIAGVKQLAADASAASVSVVSDQILRTGQIANDLSVERTVSNLEGKTLTFKYGSTMLNVKLQTGTVDGFEYRYDTMENAAASINKTLSGTSTQTGVLSDVLNITLDETLGKFVFTSSDTSGNTLILESGTDEVLGNMGFTSGSIIPDTGLTGVEPSLSHQESIKDLLAGKNISFTYNGITKKITLPSAGEITTMDALSEDIQIALNSAFGSGRIRVSLDTAGEYSSLFFETTRPDGTLDYSSVFGLTGADTGILGQNGILGISAGESNRLNLESSLLESGLAAGLGTKTGSDPLLLTVNNIEIQGLTYNSSIKEIMEAVSKTEGVNVSVNYLANADKFIFKSTEAGAAGCVEISGESASIFGSLNHVAGQDAVVSVRYANSGETLDIVRGSNNFSIDGLNISVKKEFGFDKSIIDGIIVYTEKAENEEVKFTASANSDEIVSTVKKMIEDYNALLDMVNSQLTTKRDRNYLPLTDAQKEEMTEGQIEKWEEKSKAGLLFNDSSLRSLYDDFRFMISADNGERSALAAMGVSVSTSYADNGKLILDETLLKKALESDPESVRDIFTRSKNTTTGAADGLMPKLSFVLKKYAGTGGSVKGLLVTRAGTPSVPTSILNNSIQKEINGIDKLVERLKDQMESQTDRYIKKFTNLETLISQMNSQSSWLSSALG